jgi:hypothetical protein
MLDIKTISNVYWVSDSKTRVSAVVTYNDDTSEILAVTATPGSPFWDYILENVSMETIESNTQAIIEDNQARRKIDEYRQQERDMQKKHNALFNAKIEAFDIPAVINAPSLRKSKIRKAKSITEVVAHVAICVMESERAQDV